MKYKIAILSLALTLTTPMVIPVIANTQTDSQVTSTFKVTPEKKEYLASEDITFKITGATTGKTFKVKLKDEEGYLKDVSIVDNEEGNYTIKIKNAYLLTTPKEPTLTFQFTQVNKPEARTENQTPITAEASITLKQIPVTLDSVKETDLNLPYGINIEKNITYNSKATGSWIMKLFFEPQDKYPNVGSNSTEGYLPLAEKYLPSTTAIKEYEPWLSFDRELLNKFKIVKSSLTELGFISNDINTAEMSIKLDDSTNKIDIARFLPTLKSSQTYNGVTIKDLKANGLSVSNLTTDGSVISFSATDTSSQLPTITGTIVTGNIQDIPFQIKINATRAKKETPSVSVDNITLFEGQTLKDIKPRFSASDNSNKSVSGTFAFTEKENEQLKHGTHKVKWKFTPTDETKYESVTGEVTVEVKDAKLEMKKPPQIKGSVIVGTRLEKLTFSNKGTWTLGDDKEVDNNDITVEWKYPRDTVKFNPKVDIEVTYNKKKETISIPFFHKDTIKDFLIETKDGDIKVRLDDNDIEAKGDTLIVKKYGARVTYPNRTEVTSSSGFILKTDGSLELTDKARISPNGESEKEFPKGTKIDSYGKITEPTNTTTTKASTTTTTTTKVEISTETTTNYFDNSNNVIQEYPSVSFSDIDSSWAKNHILSLAQLGIVNGHNGKFNPKGNITRADFCILIDKMLSYKDIPLTDSKVNFKDVKPTDYYYNVVTRLGASGLISGYKDQTFKPKKPISREEAVVIFDKVLDRMSANIPDMNSPTYKDFNSISEWARLPFSRVNRKGIISGSNGYFRPRNNITREESASLIYRIIEKTKQ